MGRFPPLSVLWENCIKKKKTSVCRQNLNEQVRRGRVCTVCMYFFLSYLGKRRIFLGILPSLTPFPGFLPVYLQSRRLQVSRVQIENLSESRFELATFRSTVLYPTTLCKVVIPKDLRSGGIPPPLPPTQFIPTPPHPRVLTL
jgi:hypothetical protein